MVVYDLPKVEARVRFPYPAPVFEKKTQKTQERGTREARPTDSPLIFLTNLERRLRRRALFFRRGGGSKSNAISYLLARQKEFLL